MLSRQEVLSTYPGELEDFRDLVRGLGADDMALPTRCAGWTVGDVAAHVIGSLADVAAFDLDGVGTDEWTNKQVAARKGRSADELADELDGLIKTSGDLLQSFDDAAWDGPAPAGVTGTLGRGVEALQYDVYMHADDIRTALGRPTVKSAPGLRASVSHVAYVLEDQGHAPLTLKLDGCEAIEVGGGGKEITGDAHDFVMATTGRGDPSAFGLGPEANIYREQ
jgi:uncharacterized protein (TIGR03083 family)